MDKRWIDRSLYAVVLIVIGGALTTIGAFAHLEWLKAPGATAAVIGAVWLGIALARQGFTLFPDAEAEPKGEAR